ncbi:MAG: carbamoyltransferase HypF, partial [Pirellulales bacterium]|nr:carbamoyltransferase HypF [Pirellulales bacterium]
VGFRPFVYNAARAEALSGWVRNEAGTVRIEVQGAPGAVDTFLDTLKKSPPPQARIDAIEIKDISPSPLGEGPGVRAHSGIPPGPHPSPLPEGEGTKKISPLPEGEGTSAFEIRRSSGDSPPRPTIPADLATCRECLAEISDPSERRHNYPFTNCTNCGPRWSIIERLPYDRPWTSMASFEMCPACRAEYDDPADRRFHAQPIACPRCGPTLQLLDNQGRELAVGEAALSAAAEALLAGRIVALKGLGGFQLLADATSADVVARLRRRKQRPDRPFAVMIASLEETRKYCRVSDEEARQLSSHQAPIVLLRQLAAEAASPLGVAPGNPYLGVMLPYTPLHHLLMQAVGRPLICTSGNLSEEPMAIDVEDALRRLGPIADLLLTHDRPIVRPVDDSIVRVGVDGPRVLRRARGFAPLPIELHGDGHAPTVLAVGGHLKNTVALTLGRVRETHHVQVVLSAHVGDLESTPSIDVFRRAIDDLLDFYRAVPEIVACDLHPDYASTRHAELLAARWDVPLARVQHHHAHVAACMAEHGLQGPAIGFAWDGTGYGPDGTVWGGETLLCEGAEYRRVAHLRTFALPGGDRAVREPRRSALGLLFELFGPAAAEYAADWFRPRELDNLLSILNRRVHSPRTSSMGRLFDAVAALCDLPTTITFEGQAAMALEYAADETERGSYRCSLSSLDDRIVIDWESLIRGVLADRAAGVPVSRISARFHNSLAEMAVAVAQSLETTLSLGRQLHCRPSTLPIVLSGGCFQNALLAERVHCRLSDAGFSVHNHRRTPPGDGCIALGQAFLALRQV